MPDRVLRAMHRAAPNIYEGELIALTERRDRRPAARRADRARRWRSTSATATPAGRRRSPTSSRPGDARAGARHRALRARLGARWRGGWASTVEVIDFGFRAPARPRPRRDAAARRPRAARSRRCSPSRPTPPRRCATTSPALRAALDAAGHPALLVVDCIACLACDRVRDGRLGRRRDGRRLPEGADDPAGPRASPGTGRRPRPRGSMPALALLGLGAARPARRPTTSCFCGTRADPPPLRAARGARHDPRRGGARRSLGAARASSPRAVWAAVEAWGAGGALALNIAEPAPTARTPSPRSAPAPGDGDAPARAGAPRRRA